MIPKAYITAWRSRAPWQTDAQVEQDLVISRAIIDLFSVPEIARSLLFRGGTALYKIYLTPPARYSEDIDLVQVRAEPIGETLDRVRDVLDPWLGQPSRAFTVGRVSLVYRFKSEDVTPLKLRLKIEINRREHFTALGVRQVPFEVANPWFTGRADVSTYAIDELLGSKLRALYQRKKGRDLFELSYALNMKRVNAEKIITCFKRYMEEGRHSVSRAQFEENLERKRTHPDFRDDVEPLLRQGLSWKCDEAINVVLETLVSSLPGDPWRGLEQPDFISP